MKAPILKGKKIILKPLNLNQAESFLRWFKDPAVDKFLGRDHRGLTLKKEIEFINKSRIDKTAIRWAIYTKNGELIGNTGLEQIDRKKNLKAVWGIVIGEKSYWNKGLGTDTLRVVLKFGFKKLKLNRIELEVFPYNKRGLRCYEKCGFKKEGIKRQAVKKNGKFIDKIIMGITRSDYKKFNNK
jgi:RimJ/RimL family protein N-acetyltransferase